MNKIFRNLFFAVCFLTLFAGFQQKESYITKSDGIIVPQDSLTIQTSRPWKEYNQN